MGVMLPKRCLNSEGYLVVEAAWSLDQASGATATPVISAGQGSRQNAPDKRLRGELYKGKVKCRYIVQQDAGPVSKLKTN